MHWTLKLVGGEVLEYTNLDEELAIKMSDSALAKDNKQEVTASLLPVRWWFPAIALVGMVIMKFTPDWVENGPAFTWALGAFGPVLIGFLVVLWWLFFSRADWIERLVGLLGIISLMLVVSQLGHYSIADPTSMVAIVWPLAIAGFTIGIVLFGRMQSTNRTWLALAISGLAIGYTLMLRTDGVLGNFRPDLDWRWVPTAEQIFLAEKRDSGSVSESETSEISTALRDPQWPQFRGPLRDGAQHGVRFSDDWSTPPEELWRVKVGPAWSSFVVAGRFLFTQEQRGEHETVVCYDGDTGKQIWEAKLASRFFEALGGLGPRSTPTLADGFIYAQGAEKWLVKIDASTGKEIWRTDILKISGQQKPPMWGFSTSPLVHGDLVYIHTTEPIDGEGLLAFSKENGSLKWKVNAGKMSYASPQIINVAGTEVLAILSAAGAHLLEPETGNVLLNYEWPHGGYRSLQAQLIDGNKLLIPTGMGTGTRLIQLEPTESGFEAKELWTSLRMKPDFNDLVVHKGFVYGFDDRFFAAINLEDGKQAWKGGRYGKGQLLLLADSDLLLVIGEQGELALVRASGDEFEELAQIQALSSKTWNHPVVVGDRLYLRNAEEAVGYRLPIIGTEDPPAADATTSE